MARIIVAGVGALGSHAALFLRNHASLRLIDDDRVEAKNVKAQLFGKSTVGKNKAEALRQTLDFLFGVKVEAVPHRLTADNAEALLGGGELILDCLDNGASRRVVQAFARAKGVPCLHGALAADGQLGRVVWDELFAIDDEPGEGAATCQGGEHLPFIVRVAAALAEVAQRFLEGGTRGSVQLHPGGAVRL